MPRLIASPLFFCAAALVTGQALAQLSSAPDFDAEALPVGQTKLVDGREILKTDEANLYLLSLPERFKSRYLAPMQLDERETNEALALEAGIHTLSTGRNLLKLESGDVFAFPDDIGKQVASSTAIEAQPGVYVEPEIRDRIDSLQSMSVSEALDSLDGPIGLFGIRRVSSEKPFEELALPLPPSHGSGTVHSALLDLRMDKLLKEFRGGKESTMAQDLTQRLHALAKEQTRRYELARSAAGRALAANTNANEENTPSEVLDAITTAVTGDNIFQARPNTGYALSLMLLLCGMLNLQETRSTVREISAQALQQRDEVYALTKNPFVAERLFEFSLYCRQPLLTALAGTSEAPPAFEEKATELGCFMQSGALTPYDAYNTYEIGLASAVSGPGRPFKVFLSAGDTAFEQLIETK